MTHYPFGRALSPVEKQQSRMLDSLIAYRTHSGLRMEDPPADPPANPPADPPADPPAEQSAKGYPENTPVAQMKPDEQAAYWRAQAQKHEGRNRELTSITGGKYGNDLKAELDELARLRTERMTDSEKAIEEAKKEGRAAAQQEFAPKMVKLAFDTALAHVADEARAKLIDSIATEKFVNEAGEVDTAKVKEHVALIAPGKGNGGGQQNYGQGNRNGSGSTATGVGAGAQLFNDRRSKTTPSTNS